MATINALLSESSAINISFLVNFVTDPAAAEPFMGYLVTMGIPLVGPLTSFVGAALQHYYHIAARSIFKAHGVNSNPIQDPYRTTVPNIVDHDCEHDHLNFDLHRELACRPKQSRTDHTSYRDERQPTDDPDKDHTPNLSPDAVVLQREVGAPESQVAVCIETSSGIGETSVKPVISQSEAESCEADSSIPTENVNLMWEDEHAELPSADFGIEEVILTDRPASKGKAIRLMEDVEIVHAAGVFLASEMCGGFDRVEKEVTDLICAFNPAQSRLGADVETKYRHYLLVESLRGIDGTSSEPRSESTTAVTYMQTKVVLDECASNIRDRIAELHEVLQSVRRLDSTRLTILSGDGLRKHLGWTLRSTLGLQLESVEEGIEAAKFGTVGKDLIAQCSQILNSRWQIHISLRRHVSVSQRSKKELYDTLLAHRAICLPLYGMYCHTSLSDLRAEIEMRLHEQKAETYGKVRPAVELARMGLVPWLRP